MAKAASEFNYELKEIAALLFKDAEVHEGLWTLQFQLVMAGGNFGPTEEEVVPGALIGIQRIGIKRADIKGPVTFDAAELNPK